jgi:hypothetical protein
LANKDVYISLTRGPSVTNSEGTTNAYTTNELIALKKFVEVDGKGILLHANHGPNKKYPKVYDDDYTYNNISLATNFNIELRPYIVFGKKENGYMKMSVNTNSTGQELEFISHQALTIASHDSCIIVPHTNYISIAKFPTDALIAKYKGTNNPVPQQLLRKSSESRYTDFAILVHAGKGRVIIVGNSGMIADYGSPSPSFGLVPMQSNLMFFLNCVSYLAGIVNIPPAGEGPGYPGKIIP